jgi:hypothetical protein
VVVVDDLDSGKKPPSLGRVMRHGVDIILPSSWEPQEEGMMSIVANFPSVRNQGLIVSRKKSKLKKVMLASLATALDNL